MAAVGNGLTVTVALVTAVQPAALVTVTLYVVVVAGLTLIVAEVKPVLQVYVAPPVAVKAVLFPAQMDKLPLMDAVGAGETVTVALVTEVHPVALLTVTV